jgi:DNA-binding MarR family transcriptional regulator
MPRELPAKPRLSYLLRVLSLRYSQEIAAALHAAGFGDLRPGDAKVFPFIPPHGITSGALAAVTGVRKQTMAESLEHLERAGYIERRPHPRDARSRLLFLSDRGEAVRPVATEIGRRVEQRWTDATSAREIEDLRDRLRRLLIAVAPDAAGDAVEDGESAVHLGGRNAGAIR